jgi:hypothetical protein
MKTALAALFLLALVPVSASAESDYAACMKMEALMSTPGAFLSGRGRYYRNTSYGYRGAGRSTFDSYGSTSSVPHLFGSGFLLGGTSNSWSFAENTRVLNRSYACRHLIKVKPPAYRIIGVKSPTNRTSTNVTGRQATPRTPKGFLPPAN